MDDRAYFIERPPRLQPEQPSGEIEIPSPPESDSRPQSLLQLVALPMVSIIGMILVAAMGSGRSLIMLIPMSFSLGGSIALALYVREKNHKEIAEQQAAYAQNLRALRKEMTAAHEIQLRAGHHLAPGPQESFRIAAEASTAAQAAAQPNGGRPSGPPGHYGARLWERRADDPDFGCLRLGVGAMPSNVIYHFKGAQNMSSPLARDAQRLEADSRFVLDAPVTIALRPDPNAADSGEPVNPPRHALAVFGPQPNLTYSFISALLAQYAAFHAPTDARLYILAPQEAQNAWRWALRLPHVAPSGPGQTVCFEDARDRQAEKDHNKLAIFLRGLRKTLEERRMRLGDEEAASSATLPHLLVVIDLLTAPPPGSVLNDLELDPGISLLVHEGARLGVSVIFLTPHSGRAPSGCQAVIELTPGALYQDDPAAGAGFRYAETGPNPVRRAGRADLITEPQELADFAAALQPLKVRRSYGADLPRSLDLLDMLASHSMDELRAGLTANWQRSQQADQAAWLQAALGVMSGGDIRRLTFSSDGDGVHGLVAGSTGSGKSELLATLILSLAYNFDPTILNFVLVDFKGGAAFEPFRNLPHVVDIVTNLGGNAVERMFAAITAEIHRREAINVAAGAKHIVHYRKMGLHQRPYGREVTIKGEQLYTAPYPHLFVFIDEFAEMIAESPEYKAQLNSITRLGRALGVHLILAAQRPTGVTDQMRANIKFRISLRVETREESGEILRRPDAAYLPTGIPGRGYLQVGNENIELIQVAWSGADYTGDRPVEKPPVIWRDRPARRPAAQASSDEAPKVFEVLVDLMADLARQHSVPQRKPWPDFLPRDLSLETPLESEDLSAEGLNLLLERQPESSVPDAGQPAATPQATPLLKPALNPVVRQWLDGGNGRSGAWRGADWRETAMRPLVGLVDFPEHAEQFPLLVDFRRGHAAVFGASGWGKTTFLRTLLAGLASTHSPAEMHVYILDFGGRQMSVFRDLPHVGAIIHADEEERVVRLLRMLDALLESRKTALSDAGADDLYAFNAANPTRAIPAVLALIDNFAEFREAYEGLLPMLTSIARESRAYGIHFAVTADSPGALTGKLFNLFTERMALKLTEAGDYLAIVGRGARQIDDIPGRGYVPVGRRALAFQAALPVGAPGAGAAESAQDGAEDTQSLARLVRALAEAASRIKDLRRPAPIQTLANRVQLAALLTTPLLTTPPPTEPALRPILGIDDRNLEPWRFDARRDGPHMLIIGPPGTGKTAALRSIVLSLAHLYPPERAALLLVDFQNRFVTYGGRHTLADLPHVLAAMSNPQELDAFVELLKTEIVAAAAAKRSIFVLIDNYDTFVDEARISRTAMPLLGSLAREYGTGGLHFVLAGSQDASRSGDELRKQVSQARFGVALGSAELVSNLNGRPPRGLAAADLPPGRAFVVRGGKTFMVQLATPYGASQQNGGGMSETEDQPEVSLDAWVKQINERYPHSPPRLRPLGSEAARPPAATPAAASGNGGAAAPAAAGAAASPLPEGVDIETLKPRLIDAGLAPALLALLSPNDLISMAAEMKIFEGE